MVEYLSLSTPDANQGRYTVVVRTRYQRYIGDFVLHCHILDHEDQGMMQNVRIQLSGGPGASDSKSSTLSAHQHP